MVMLHIKLKGMKHTIAQQIFYLTGFHTLLTPVEGSKGQIVFFFSESSHVAYQINGNEA